MARTVIALADDDKAWLDREAAHRGIPMTELVRRAVHLLRQQCARNLESFDDLLGATAGTWTHGDGLEYQERLRREWDREDDG